MERLGVGLDELERLHEVLSRVNAAALAAGRSTTKGSAMNRPGPLQYIAYAYGRRYPTRCANGLPTTLPIMEPSADT